MRLPKCGFIFKVLFLFVPSLTLATYHKHFLTSLDERYEAILNTETDLDSVNGALRWPPTDPSGNVPLVASTDTEESLRQKINDMLGDAPEPGQFPKSGYVFTMVQAYKIVIYDDPLIDVFRKFARRWRLYESNARNHQRNINNILWRLYLERDRCLNISIPFRQRLEGLNPANSSVQTDGFHRIIEGLEGPQDQLRSSCLNFTEEEREVATADLSLAHNLLDGYTSALYIFGYVSYLATGFEQNTFQGRAARFPISPFNKMVADTRESMLRIQINMIEFEENRNNTEGAERAYWQDKLDHYDFILSNEPYSLIAGYVPSLNYSILQSLRIVMTNFGWGITPGYQNFTRSAYLYLRDIYHIYEDDIRNTYSGRNATEMWRHTNLVYDELSTGYSYFLEVGEKSPNATNKWPLIDWDDEETWDFGIHPSQYPIQNMRLAWNYLDRVVEEQNCYLHKLYWQDLRNETLGKTQYERKKVFSQISKTFLMPCRPFDEDIVSFCTAENYEICRPVHMSEDQISHVEDTSDLAFFRPKWVFTRTEEQPGDITTTKCTGKLTYIPLYFVCRCGFRDDCGDDFGSHLTCVLQANDMYRKQCKGSIGYPCKTLPFAPGKHDESCITGYCDRKLNSCEEDERYYPDYTGDPRRWLSTNEAGETNRIIRFDKTNRKDKV